MKQRELITMPEIARRLGVPQHRVDYYLRSRNLEPTEVIANIRLYDVDMVMRVAAALKEAKETT